MATRGTIESNSWERSLKKEIDVKVYNQACPLLAPMAEEGWIRNEIAVLTIKEYLKEFKKLNLDAIILGCTHYPLFEDIIHKEMPNVETINTGKIIAKELEKNRIFGRENNTKDEFYLTDIQCNFENVANNILEKKIEIKKIEI